MDEHAEGEPVGDRTRAAEVVADKLGELVVDLHEEVHDLPRWRPCPFRLAGIERALGVGVTFYTAWRQAFPS